MAPRSAFLRPAPCILPILLSAVCFLAPAAAQHGGGGGHSGGGHLGGGHSSRGHASSGHSGGSQTSGHFGWLGSAFGKHSDKHAGFAASSNSDTASHGPGRLWSISTSPPRTSTLRIPSTLLWSPTPYPHRGKGQVGFVSPAATWHHHHGFPVNRFPRFSSGCFWNGVSQICFFEPLLPLLCFYAGFDSFYSGLGLGGETVDQSYDLNFPGIMESQISAVPPSATLSDDDTVERSSGTHAGPAAAGSTGELALGKRVFLLVLNNGSSQAVTDYWVADGYLEYISPDGSRSHIPLEALDLQSTVAQNAPRGLPFVLRSLPAPNR
jgi:hypothetical protein